MSLNVTSAREPEYLSIGCILVVVVVVVVCFLFVSLGLFVCWLVGWGWLVGCCYCLIFVVVVVVYFVVAAAAVCLFVVVVVFGGCCFCFLFFFLSFLCYTPAPVFQACNNNSVVVNTPII